MWWGLVWVVVFWWGVVGVVGVVCFFWWCFCCGVCLGVLCFWCLVGVGFVWWLFWFVCVVFGLLVVAGRVVGLGEAWGGYRV
ncbi:hypothetical protein [Pseudomonas syringae group genomosp. 7]|uniref:hypothetical protein n=1 Tax=Pseudomonas syringae group genomosp. 7 TaxID=251699 RepID=UPI00376FB7A3